jgi:hypothetical protein
MKKVVRLTESGLKDIIEKVLQEQKNNRYMFFSNLEQIHRQTGLLLERSEEEIYQILENGHDWAQDHIATAKESMDQVFDFLMNEEKSDEEPDSFDMMQEGRKKAGTKLCARGLAAAKGKFKVFPSAYSNGYAVQVCKGTKPGMDGKKKCSPPYC